MRRSDCSREAELLEALQNASWPAGGNQDLRAHVAACRSCAELVAVVLPLVGDRLAATREAHVPSSGIMWWRLQMRARREAARAASRPIAVVQGLALACAAGLLVAIIGFASPLFRQSAAWMVRAAGTAASIEFPLMPWPDLPLYNPLGLAGLLALGLIVVAAPVALYFAIGDD